ncbi:MAG: hypothetical protein JJT81_09980 [Rubellimicrobium sp.]|nr:hypothetical protein [Rubellimicrobium sp.]
MTADAALFALALAVVFLLRRLWSRPHPAHPQPGRTAHLPAAIPALPDLPDPLLVDGSNVMFWDDNRPTTGALLMVIGKLQEEGNDPVVCFDANVGYKLANRPLDREALARLLDLPPAQVLICPSRTDADAMILRLAAVHRLAVVSNDRFRDYPAHADKIARLGGSIARGKVTLRRFGPGLSGSGGRTARTPVHRPRA